MPWWEDESEVIVLCRYILPGHALMLRLVEDFDDGMAMFL
jgi:hypothetical protein